VIGSDPEGRLGEAPRPELREHGRISGACFDAASGIIPGLKVLSMLILACINLMLQNMILITLYGFQSSPFRFEEPTTLLLMELVLGTT
jgi:hypothetical protein